MTTNINHLGFYGEDETLPAAPAFTLRRATKVSGTALIVLGLGALLVALRPASPFAAQMDMPFLLGAVAATVAGVGMVVVGRK